MINRNKASISKFIIHKVGNKFNDTRNAYSENEVVFDEESYNLILPFLLKSFTSVAETYRFNHHANIDLNEINRYSSAIFEDDSEFIEMSKNIVVHLFEQSRSAQIKTGDVAVAVFENIEYNQIMTNAIGIFKIETKTPFFQTYAEDGSYDIAVQNGISTKKLDKGCLILNTTDGDGRVILSVDNNNYDTMYWITHFLNIKYPDDSNQHTKNFLELCKDFSGVLEDNYDKQTQSAFLAKTIDYCKENESVNLEEFKDSVFETDDDENYIEQFEAYKKEYEEDMDVVIRNHFDVSTPVLKKQKQKIKTDIKLDTNIQIKLDIDAPDASTEYIQRGYDDDKKMHYYKVFFNEEA